MNGVPATNPSWESSPGDNSPSQLGVDQPTVTALAREVEEFVATGGWDQPTQLFALVPTTSLLELQPDLAGQVDAGAPLTPVAQEALPEGDLGEALAGIMWPETVHGCALVQEIVVLPPGAEQDLPGGEDADDGAAVDAERLRAAAADHPDRTEARLVAAVLRDGPVACVLRLRDTGSSTETGSDSTDTEEVIVHPELAPNLTDALRATLTAP
ncbi:hypothetical protein EV191_12134 [Tamaricihabitans halophyticus]|uniref:Uncharacterized protein n=2 Tax=Tamaricihabitans halophyticus TaxID=1262583 RepID=A0A4R2Q4W0_9PSEU|nr:hypothetical protein EV191_12134 [Tamaricihabitans halophyticus]